jgi:flagellar protein FlaG
MLIQNSTSAASAPGLTGNSAPAGVSGTPQGEPATAAPAPKPAHPTEAQIKSAVDNINRAMKQNNTNVEFSIDKNTKQMVIKVVESGTGQVIQQFPSTQVLAISQMIGNEEPPPGIMVKHNA